LVDSGYASEANEDDDGPEYSCIGLNEVRQDAFERSCAQRWVTGFVTKAEDCPAFTDEDARQSVLEDAYMLIEALSVAAVSEGSYEDDASEGFRRDFSFEVKSGDSVKVFLHDKLAGTNSADPDDVGLQSWGASILFSRLLCREPARFGLIGQSSHAAPRIVELGAGTGLVSLALGALLPTLGQRATTLIATDYHPAVLENLRDNVRSNLSDHDSLPIATCALDWSNPVWDIPLDQRADIVIATDVIYSPLHAAWVKDCVSKLLASDGTFWLMVAVRRNGRFEGVSETVEAVFPSADSLEAGRGPQLCIQQREKLEKPVGIGRGDESWYELFQIGWH
jgi:hypothetical protein